MGETNSCVAGGILLLGGDGGAGALGGVEGRLAAHDRLTGGTASADVLANLDGLGIPARHRDGFDLGLVWCGGSGNVGDR